MSAPVVFKITKTETFNRLLNFTTGTFYAHLLTTHPTDILFQTVSQLVVASNSGNSSGNYAPAILKKVDGTENAGATLMETASGLVVTFANPLWESLQTNYPTSNLTIKGMAICRRAGTTPAGTDKLVTYCPLNSAYIPNGANFTIQIPATGILEVP